MFPNISSIKLLLVSISVVIAADIPCNDESIIKLDENISKLSVIGDPIRNFPNIKEVQSHCQLDNQMITWGKNYTKTCLVTRKVETSRHVTNLLMFSMKKVINKRCRSEASRNVFIKAGKCGNAAKSDTITCFNQYSTESGQINKAKMSIITNEKHLLPLLCCSYHKFHDCCVNVWAKTKYADVCNQKATVELEGWINDSMYDTIQYLCGDYQEYSDKCDNLLNRYKEVFTSVRINSIPKSPLSSSNEVFNSIPPL